MPPPETLPEPTEDPPNEPSSENNDDPMPPPPPEPETPEKVFKKIVDVHKKLLKLRQK